MEEFLIRIWFLGKLLDFLDNIYESSKPILMPVLIGLGMLLFEVLFYAGFDKGRFLYIIVWGVVGALVGYVIFRLIGGLIIAVSAGLQLATYLAVFGSIIYGGYLVIYVLYITLAWDR